MLANDHLRALWREVLARHWDWWRVRREAGGVVTTQPMAWPLFAARQKARQALWELREAKVEQEREAA